MHWLLLQRDQVLFPAPTQSLPTISTSSCRGTNALFWLLMGTDKHSVQTHIQANTSRYNFKKLNKSTICVKVLIKYHPFNEANTTTISSSVPPHPDSCSSLVHYSPFPLLLYFFFVLISYRQRPLVHFPATQT